ncbi:MAG: hypothetical protein GXO65_06380 [Euryarchaeota archaeon]|nr:hypothetical protein [Euryarchaeota archaeon]
MIFNPWIIAQIFGLAVVLVLSLYGAAVGVRILRRWDIESPSQEQLELERRTYLVSTIMQYVLGFEVLSLLVFVMTAEALHTAIQGAMCAFGSLNANPYGFRTLGVKILSVFFYSTWLAVNYLDSQAEDYPLVRFKYLLLLLILPILATEVFFELKYFLAIKPNVITSCCGSVLQRPTNPYGFILLNIPKPPVVVLFYAGVGATALLHILYRRGAGLAYPVAALSIATFGISLVALMVFLGPYMNVLLYGLPTEHRCPFEVLAGPYYIGYPLYTALFLGGIFGMLVGVVEPFKKHPTIREATARFQARASLISLGGFLVFTAICTGSIGLYYLALALS